MARAQVPIVLTGSSTLQSEDVDLSATRVILRARSSDVQAVSCNLTLDSETDPTGAGANAFVLFPGASLALDSAVAGLNPVQVKYITFNDDTDLDDPLLEVIEII